MSARVIGLDLSIAATGVAEYDDIAWTIKGKAADGDGRLTRIAREVKAVAVDADLAVIEDLPTHAHGAGITGMVHGAVRLTLLQLGVEYVTVPPATLKKYATGRGNCGKPEMAVALYKRCGLELTDDNQTDAAWLRFLGLDLLGAPAFDLPASQRSAIDALRPRPLDPERTPNG